MNRDDIIEMANRSGVMPCYMGDTEALERFAALVAAAEREECAKVCEKYTNDLEGNYSEIIADEIRERGEQ